MPSESNGHRSGDEALRPGGPSDALDFEYTPPSSTPKDDLETGRERKYDAPSPDRATGQSLESRTEEVIALGRWRKYLLLSVFCLGVFIDVMGVCAFYILLGPVANDLDIPFDAQTWIINAFADTPPERALNRLQTSFAISFASFLLFWGRVSDLYSPTPVFGYGFLALGVLNLIISFLTNSYAFLILRAISGIAGSCLIPASYRLIMATFAEHELQMAFVVYSLSGSLGASFGVPIAGLVELIHGEGQMAGWRWFFRITTILIVPVSLWSLRSFPKVRGGAATIQDKWRRLDLPGTLIMLLAILLLILALTLGATHSFSTAYFLAPFLISLPLFPLFFYWESRARDDYALIPAATWRLPNFTLWVVLSTFTSGWWTCNQIPVIEVFVQLRGEKAIIAALRIIPEGLIGLVGSVLMIIFPIVCQRPRWSYTLGQIGGMIAYVLFIFSYGAVDDRYWKFGFTGATLGSFANSIATTCTIVGAMAAIPPSQAGVAGAILQTAVQAGNAIAIAIQAGMLTVHPGGINDWRNVQASFWFMFAWGGAFAVAFWMFYRPVRPRIGMDGATVQVESGPSRAVH